MGEKRWEAKVLADCAGKTTVPNPRPGTQNPGLKPRNPEPGTCDPRPGTRNPKPEPGTRNPRPATSCNSRSDTRVCFLGTLGFLDTLDVLDTLDIPDTRVCFRDHGLL